MRVYDIEFPRALVRVGACVAIFKKKIGHRKKPGPCVKGRKRILFEGEHWKPGRLSYHLNCKPIPRTPPSLKVGLVLHTCDHEWCVDPDHLYFGTQSQNQFDNWGRHPTIRMKNRLSHLGLKHTKEARRKISENNRVRWKKERAI
jgi:hypothetical protein